MAGNYPMLTGYTDSLLRLPFYFELTKEDQVKIIQCDY